VADLLDHVGDVGVGRRLDLDKPGLESLVGTIDKDPLDSDKVIM